jgi:predicted nucleic acid-binding protein
MTTVLLDTNAVSDMMRDHPVLKARFSQHRGKCITTVTVVGEVRFGLDRLPVGKKRSDLENRALRTLSSMRIRSVTLAVAQEYASMKTETERLGLTVGDNDLWIASAARYMGITLITRDRIFSLLPGLVVEDWTI